MRKNKWISLIVAILAVLLLVSCADLPKVHSMGQQATDVLYSMIFRKVDPKINIIAVDAKSEEAFGYFASWDRSYAAELVELLNQPEHKPAVIAFDLNYPTNRDPEGDAAFAKAAAEAGNVVVASRAEVYTRVVEENGSFVENSFYVESFEYPYDALRAVTTYGFSNTAPDSDDVVRHAILSLEHNGERMYSFSYQTYLKYMEFLGKEPYVPPVDGMNLYGIRYIAQPDNYNRVSWVDVVSGERDLSGFKDSVVLIGAYTAGMMDQYFVPISSKGQMYGVEIHANIVDSLCRGYSYVAANSTLVRLVNVVLCVLFFLVLWKTNLPISLVSFVLLEGGYVWTSVKLYEKGQYVYPFGFVAVLFLMLVGHIAWKYVGEWLSKRHIMKEFKKYVAPQVLEQMYKSGEFSIKLGGEAKDIAVLFVDIRGFTTLSESLEPEQVVEMLNEYFALTTEAIFANGGTLDKFIGDATMALFNAPVDLPDYEAKAVQAALDIVKGAAKVNERIKDKIGREVAFGVGVNCGKAVVGNVGCDIRMDYTAIGDTVNTAARLEGKAKGGQVVISEELRKRLEGRIVTEPLGTMELKGKAEPLAVYGVVGFTDTAE